METVVPIYPDYKGHVVTDVLWLESGHCRVCRRKIYPGEYICEIKDGQVLKILCSDYCYVNAHLPKWWIVV